MELRMLLQLQGSPVKVNKIPPNLNKEIRHRRKNCYQKRARKYVPRHSKQYRKNVTDRKQDQGDLF